MEDNNTVKLPIYECSVCGYKYDPSMGDPQQVIAPGTPFDELPPDWVCPICGASKDLFNKLESKSKPSQSESEIKPQKTVKEYRGKDIIVYWCPQDCSHSGKCWGGLPEVFDMDKRPWINISGSSAEDIIRTIDKCPSRALQYSLPEDSSVDPTLAKGPGANDRKIDPSAAAGKIRVIRDGPLWVEGPNRIFDAGGTLIGEADRFVLCRCGKTNNSPFCDGSHIPGHE